MATGDVEVQIIPMPMTTASIDTALTAMRATAQSSGAYLMTQVDNQVVLCAISG